MTTRGHFQTLNQPVIFLKGLKMAVIVFDGRPGFGHDDFIKWVDDYKTNGFVLNVPKLLVEKDTFRLHKAKHATVNNFNNGEGSFTDGKRYKVVSTSILEIRKWTEEAFIAGEFSDIELTSPPKSDEVKCGTCGVIFSTENL